MGFAKVFRPPVYLTLAVVSRDRVVKDDPSSVLAAGAPLRGRSYELTLAYWNRDGEDPGSVVSRYEQALGAVRDVGGRGYLSIKGPAFDCDPELFARLLARSRDYGVPLHFDALGAEHAEETFGLLSAALAQDPHAVGCTLPGRWRRSLEDAERLADLDVPIRVVKGEWPDPDAPTLDPAAGFIQVVERLAGRVAGVRVATHDGALASHCLDLLRDAGTPCDLELLYGFPVRRMRPGIRELGVPVRVYVPFGHGWIPYCMQHLRSRPSVLGWLVRDWLAGRYSDGFPPIGDTTQA